MDAITNRASYMDRPKSTLRRYRRKDEVVDWRTKLVRLLVIQSAICVLISLILVGVKTLETPYSQAMNSGLNSLLTYSIDVNQSVTGIQQAFTSIFAQTNQPVTDTAPPSDGGASQ